MNISANKPSNKKAKDAFDKLIFEDGLRITKAIADKKLNVLIVILNNAKILKIRLSDYKNLSKAKQSELDNYTLIQKGIGISWASLDEDLSLKGIIKESALNAMLSNLQNKGDFGLVA
jgi:hypothetical protein